MQGLILHMLGFISMYICADAHMPQCICGGHRAACRSQSSPLLLPHRSQGSNSGCYALLVRLIINMESDVVAYAFNSITGS